MFCSFNVPGGALYDDAKATDIADADRMAIANASITALSNTVFSHVIDVNGNDRNLMPSISNIHRQPISSICAPALASNLFSQMNVDNDHKMDINIGTDSSNVPSNPNPSNAQVTDSDANVSSVSSGNATSSGGVVNQSGVVPVRSVIGVSGVSSDNVVNHSDDISGSHFGVVSSVIGGMHVDGGDTTDGGGNTTDGGGNATDAGVYATDDDQDMEIVD